MPADKRAYSARAPEFDEITAGVKRSRRGERVVAVPARDVPPKATPRTQSSQSQLAATLRQEAAPADNHHLENIPDGDYDEITLDVCPGRKGKVSGIQYILARFSNTVASSLNMTTSATILQCAMSISSIL